VKDDERILFHSGFSETKEYFESGKSAPSFEKAGPREKIYFDPSQLKCGIVTCGGLCPGLNSVIRAIVLSLHYNYGVRTVYGFPYGYEGLTSHYGHKPVELTPTVVDRIHEQGGTILARHVEIKTSARWSIRWSGWISESFSPSEGMGPCAGRVHLCGNRTQEIEDRCDPVFRRRLTMISPISRGLLALQRRLRGGEGHHLGPY